MANAKFFRGGGIVQLKLDIQQVISLGIASDIDRIQERGWVDDLIKKETEYKQTGGDDSKLQDELENNVAGTDFTDKIVIQNKTPGVTIPDPTEAWTKQLQHALYRLNEKITLNQDTESIPNFSQFLPLPG